MGSLKQYILGEEIEGFVVQSVTNIEIPAMTLYTLEDSATGARYLHAASDDDENCFAVAFRTVPKDSSGIAHILEHVVLCGSEKYPVRDPFFSMLKRSLSTFMNAFTAADWTMYPFATRNEADFYNLLGIYLDASFFPLIKEESFMQEGHHLMFKDMEGSAAKLGISGVVFNEMKGDMSSQSSVMHEKTTEALFPTITYHYNSGGSPAAIPHLTYENLKEFHRNHYHPSNAWFYSYGSLPLDKHLKVIRKTVLDKFKKRDIDLTIPPERRFSSPQSFRFPYPASEEGGDACQTAQVWLTNSSKNVPLTVSMSLLDEMLLGNAASPLRKALVESKLGKSLSDVTGYMDEYSETFFGAGLQGVPESDTDKVRGLVLGTLDKIERDGIDRKQIDSVIHGYELSNRELAGGSYPKGLKYILKAFTCWTNGADPAEVLDFSRIISGLKNNLAQNPRHFEDIIRQNLLDNPHRADILLYPDPGYEDRQDAEIDTILAEKEATLTEAGRQEIKAKLDSLEMSQSQQDDHDALPFLSLDNIKPKETLPAPTEIDEAQGLYLYETKTNGLAYYSVNFCLPELTREERLMLPVFSLLLNKTGTQRLSYDELSLELNLYTGGVGGGELVMHDPHSNGEFFDMFSFKGKALERNIGKLFELSDEVFHQHSFANLERIGILLKQKHTQMVNSISHSGHSFASQAAAARLLPVNAVSEAYGGMTHIEALAEWAKLKGSDLEAFAGKLHGLGQKIFASRNIKCAVFADKAFMPQARNHVDQFLAKLPKSTDAPKVNPGKDFTVNPANEARCFTSPVSYVAKAMLLPAIGHPDAPKLLIASTLLGSNIVHQEIREKGGAYGGMARYNPLSGIFAFATYRDPHYKRSLDFFNGIAGSFKKLDGVDKMVPEAVLSAFRQMDAPLSPAEKCSKDFHRRISGQTEAETNTFREQLLAVSEKDVREVVARHLTQSGSQVTLTSDEIYARDYGSAPEQERPAKLKAPA